ncbi:glycoside hydrolase [Armillaria nabsnona]|nr:glycoside hydrolase [Armillaria nabsnona]
MLFFGPANIHRVSQDRASLSRSRRCCLQPASRDSNSGEPSKFRHSSSITLDFNWRWTHQVSSSTNCYTGNTWDTSICPDPITCATNCALDGADYAGTYGITTSSDALTLKFVTHKYQMFNLKNQQLTFDVDMSTLPCGLNGALYFVDMDADGRISRFPTNKAGCPHDIKFINGQANILGWTPSPSDPNAGSGQFGSRCNEIANSQAAAVTPHVCLGITGQTRCSGTQCGDGDERAVGVCDKDGCDFNSWRMSNQNFLGPGKTINTNSKFTVVTRFLTSDNTATGTLREIRRLYVQDGSVIQNSETIFPGISAYDSITDSFCADQKALFGDPNTFRTKGGLTTMGNAFGGGGMALVMSIWDDHAANMLWLDSDYPATASASQPGVSRGPCSTASGQPSQVESQSGNAQVIFPNIKTGPIGSTCIAILTIDEDAEQGLQSSMADLSSPQLPPTVFASCWWRVE